MASVEELAAATPATRDRAVDFLRGVSILAVVFGQPPRSPGTLSGATKSARGRPAPQFIVWPGPAMKPSSDIDLFTTTFPMLVLLTPVPPELGCSGDSFRPLRPPRACRPGDRQSPDGCSGELR
jgi:hypothetical protein